MTSIFDQYEQASTRGMAPPRPGVSEPIATGFINARLEDDTPIFSKQRINFTPPDPITNLCVCNGQLVMAMTSNILLRIDLEHPDTTDEVEMPKAVDDRIAAMFLDPTGKHLIVSMASSDNYYLARASKKPRALSKLKGHQVTAVGWNKQNMNDNSTGEILLGTSLGLIFETEIIAGEDSKFFQASLEQYVKQLFDLGREKHVKITGLEIERYPSHNLTEYKYFVMATTPGRLYQFLGTVPNSAEAPVYQHIFTQYIDVPESFLELPGSCGYSELKYFHPKFRALPKTFAWMTGPGIYYGTIDVKASPSQDSLNTVTTNTRLMLYSQEEGETKPATPIAVALTEFHLLIMYPDRLKSVCVLNEQPIYDDAFSDSQNIHISEDIVKFGKLLGMCKDPQKGTVWAFTSKAVFKYKVIRESRDVWQIYLDQGKFDLAKQYCRDNPANMDKVLTREAEKLYENKDFMESAEVYAQTHTSFEEVALKFIKLIEKDALKKFLLRKLASLKAQDKTQITMLVLWLIELYLNQLGKLKEQGTGDQSPAYAELQEEFRKFLTKPKAKECVTHNKGTVYEVISSHGDVENMIFFAVLMQDYEKVMRHHIHHDSYTDALKVLSNQDNVELFYKFSPVLMQHIARQTVDAWINKGKKLDPKKLIPALVQYDQESYHMQGNEAIRYLEYCVDVLNNQDEAIHNYLLALYAKLQPESLLTYLTLQGTDNEIVSYDLKYALRLCSDQGHKKACVHIYSTMGLYEEAVDLALDVDVDLAKLNADKPEDDEELKKKLWLRIARHVVEEEKDVKRAMEFLHECELLKIEDILPFFPDFVTIDHFKDAICQSLQEYNQHIETLKEEMDEATQSAQEIRSEIASFRNKYNCVKAQDKCSACGFPVMTRAFYVFPCLHRFHNDCLIAEVLPQLSTSRRAKAEDLHRKLAANEYSGSQPPSANASPISKRKDHKIKEELDDIIAAECVYCGEIMIRSVDKPFINEEEYEEEIKSWL